jgi:hypothetical protein
MQATSRKAHVRKYTTSTLFYSWKFDAKFAGIGIEIERFWIFCHVDYAVFKLFVWKLISRTNWLDILAEAYNERTLSKAATWRLHPL